MMDFTQMTVLGILNGCGRGWWEAGAPADLGFLRTLQGRVGRGPLGCVSAGDRADGQGAH